MSNPEVSMTLDDCVDEVLGMLTGLDLSYTSEHDRYRAVTRQINRALRANALEREWSYYHSRESLGLAVTGVQEVTMRATVRPRIIGDDSVVLADPTTHMPVVWAAFLPRDAIEKYPLRRGLWCAVVRQSLRFSRPFQPQEDGLEILVPVMREPKMFRLPPHPETPEEEEPVVDDSVRNQLLDFDYPDLVLARAAYYVAQSDPVMQPRAQTLEQQYKELFYALNERDDRNTDSPFLNEWFLPIASDLNAPSYQDMHHPHADERY